MARKEIGSIFDRNNRNNMNDNFKELYEDVDKYQSKITDKVYSEIVDSAKLDWKEPVNNFSDLPSVAKSGETRLTRDTGKVYRYDGESWIEIQEIDVSPVNEVDSRLSIQLADKAEKSELEIERARISNLTAHAGDTDGNAELIDIRVGYDGITYDTAGEATRALQNYMEIIKEEKPIFPIGVTGALSSQINTKSQVFEMKKNRKLTHVGAAGTPSKYRFYEIELIGGVITKLSELSSGLFSIVDGEYSYGQLNHPVLLRGGKKYMLSVEYGDSDTAKYIRTKFLEEFIGYDGYEDEVFKTGEYSAIHVRGHFPKINEKMSRAFYYDFKFVFENYEIKKEVHYIEKEEMYSLKGLRVGLLGSSSMDTNMSWKNFMEYISDRTGIILENYAVGGSSTTAKSQDWENDTGVTGLKKAKQMTVEKPNLDVVLCQPLINDEYLKLGTFESEDPTTCYGAMHIIAKMLLEKYPEKPIGFMTGQYIPGENERQSSLRHKCIKEIGAYYGIPVLDLRAEGQTPYMIESFKDKYVPDGTHLNDAGNKIISRSVEAFLRKITIGYTP